MSEFDTDQEFLKIFLEEARDILSDWERNCLALQSDPSQAVCSALFRAAHNLKGSARSVGLAEYGTFIHTAEDVITNIRDGKTEAKPEIVKALLDAQAILLEWRDGLDSDSKCRAPSRTEDIRAKLKAMIGGSASQALDTSAGFGFFEDTLPQVPVYEESAPASFARGSTPGSSPNNQSKSKSSGNDTIRIPATRIDGLMQLIGELSIQQATILHSLKNNSMHEPICHRAVQIAGKLTRELQLQTMALRLIDLSKLFQKLERTARDLALDQKKAIRIELSGSDVELDKNVIERISDALVHMIRNAVDHGIESKEQRGQKPECATLTLAAFQSASGVTIEISDDGAGINHERVLTKAIGMGLARPSDNLSPSKIYEFMFAPGFSTASKVTEVSGRGVGLDVVKRNIDELGGSIDIQSTVGVGTKFSISIPLTVSIVDSLIILSDGFSYVVPIQEISEIIDLRSFTSESQNSESSTISLRDRALTIRPLNTFLTTKSHKKSTTVTVTGNHKPVMVIETEGQKVGFSFDSIVGQQPILIRQLADYISDMPGFTGNTVLANGDPALIVSPKEFARLYFKKKDAA